MNSSGLLFADTTLVSAMFYLFAGWILTTVGVGLSLFVKGRRVQLILLHTLPLLYIMLLQIASIWDVETNVVAEWIVVLGTVTSVLVGPISAAALLVKQRRNRPFGKGAHAHS